MINASSKTFQRRKITNTSLSAVWTNTFPQALGRYLPESAQANLTDIYEDIDTQLSYAAGTDVRIGIQDAYGYAQERMLIAGLAVISLAFVWVLMIKNIDLKKVPQVKGVVF
jgi:hypothetical protein